MSLTLSTGGKIWKFIDFEITIFFPVVWEGVRVSVQQLYKYGRIFRLNFIQFLCGQFLKNKIHAQFLWAPKLFYCNNIIRMLLLLHKITWMQWFRFMLHSHFWLNYIRMKWVNGVPCSFFFGWLLLAEIYTFFVDMSVLFATLFSLISESKLFAGLNTQSILVLKILHRFFFLRNSETKLTNGMNVR